MQTADHLVKARRTEKTGRVVRRMSMLIVFLNLGGTFSIAAETYGCDRRTVSMWWRRLRAVRMTPGGIRNALSDKPRSGRPPKISRDVLEEARKWCTGRVFTPAELRDTLEKMSGVKLSMCQVRRHARKWGNSRKKTQPLEIKRASMRAVRVWRHRL